MGTAVDLVDSHAAMTGDVSTAEIDTNSSGRFRDGGRGDSGLLLCASGNFRLEFACLVGSGDDNARLSSGEFQLPVCCGEASSVICGGTREGLQNESICTR